MYLALALFLNISSHAGESLTLQVCALAQQPSSVISIDASMTGRLEQIVRALEGKKILESYSESELKEIAKGISCSYDLVEGAFRSFKNSNYKVSHVQINKNIFYTTRILSLFERLDQNLNSYSVADEKLKARFENKSSMNFMDFVNYVRNVRDTSRSTLLGRLKNVNEDLGGIVEVIQHELLDVIGDFKSEQQELILEAFFSIVFKNAFSFTLMGVEDLKSKLRTAMGVGENERNMDAIQKRLAQLENSKGIVYEDFLSDTLQKLQRKGVSQDLVLRVLNRVMGETKDHFIIEGVALKEGDILVEYDGDGWSDIFYSLIGLNSLFGHSRVIASGLWGPVKTYFIAEALDGFNVSAIDSLSSHIVLRFSKQDLNGKTFSAIQKLQNRGVIFDLLFNSQMFDSKNSRYSLYCSEFIHYLFKNGFDSHGPVGISPFDFVEFKANFSNPLFVSNMASLGINPRETFFVPDQLFLNPATEIVGLGSFQKEGGTHPSRARLHEELDNRFNEEFGKAFGTRRLKPIGLFEKAQLAIKLQAARFFSSINPDDIDGFATDAKYYFMKMILISDKFMAVDFNEGSNLQGPVTKTEYSQVLQKYNEDVTPLINDMFE